jgi:hypothetical protein
MPAVAMFPETIARAAAPPAIATFSPTVRRVNLFNDITAPHT